MNVQFSLDVSGLWLEPAPLLLASKSAIRAKILTDARIPVDARPSEIDERAVERSLAEDKASPENVALMLAAAKAMDVSTRIPSRLVLGCDQTLSLGPERFTKPVSRDDARAQLMALSGRTHVLTTGAALAREGAVVWSAVAEARMSVRPFSDAFVDAYLEEAGDGVFSSVGGYHFEGLGAQLFDKVEGSFHTVLGLPLLPVLSGLRSVGALAS